MASFEHINDHVENAILRRVEPLVDGRGWGAVPDLMERWIEAARVRLVYEQESNPEFAEVRRRLNTEPGVIIANHPGLIDIPAVLKVITRPDIKIVINADDYKRLGTLIGDTSHFVEASTEVSKVRQNFDELTQHIARGGAVLIFPAGTRDTESRDRRQFKSGFRHLLETTLTPEHMVYAFHINRQDVWSVRDEKIPRQIGALGEALLGKGANINRHKERKVIRVNEAYTQASEWQEVLSDKGSADDNRRLTAHFYEKFEQAAPGA